MAGCKQSNFNGRIYFQILGQIIEFVGIFSDTEEN